MTPQPSKLVKQSETKKGHTMIRHERAQQYALHLQREGYAATVTASGAVRFDSGMREYYLMLHEDDVIRVTITRSFWRASTAEEEKHAHMAALDVTENAPIAKIRVRDRNVSAIVDAHLLSHGIFYDTSWRYIEALDTAVEEFVRIMRDTMPQPPVVPYPITLDARAAAYCRYLASRGFSAWVDPGETVAFSHEGREYVLRCDDTHDHRLILTHRGALAKVRNAKERARAATVAKNVTNIHPRVAISATTPGEVHASVHIYMADPMVIGDGFADCFSELKTAAERFNAQMANAMTANA